MAKRYTKRAYKKRRTLRKLRVKHRNTQRGGLGFDNFLDNIKANTREFAAAAKATLNDAAAAGKAKVGELAAANPEIMGKLTAAEAKGRELAAAGKAKGRELAAANPDIMGKLTAAEAKGRELAAAGKAKVGEFAVANPTLTGLMTDVQARVANGVANGKAMVANGMPTATVLTKTSLGALNAFVALAKAMYSLMDMINIAKYYTSNPTFALAQLKEKTSEIRTNLLATYPDIDTCITVLQTAIESAPSQPSPPELIPPESFIEKLTRLHNEICTEGVSKLINRDISVINVAMIEMSKKSENQGLIECFNKMKDTVLPTEDSKKSIISGITKLRTANPKTFSAGLKLVVGTKAIGAKMATAGVQAQAAVGQGLEQAQAAVGQGLKQAQAAVGQGLKQAQAAVGQGLEQAQAAATQRMGQLKPAIEPASQQAAAAMSSIKSGPSQAATAALDEVKKDAEAYAAKTETALQDAKKEVAKTTQYINDNESKLSKAMGITWQMEKNQYNIRKEFQTQIFNAASNYAYNAATLLDKANAAAAPQLSNEARKAALIELKNAAQTNVATTANLLKTATNLDVKSKGAKTKGPDVFSVNKEDMASELNQHEIKSTNNLRAAKKQYEEAKALLDKVNIAQQLM